MYSQSTSASIQLGGTPVITYSGNVLSTWHIMDNASEEESSQVDLPEHGASQQAIDTTLAPM